jgi:phosphopantetheine adenylyltransferase
MQEDKITTLKAAIKGSVIPPASPEYETAMGMHTIDLSTDELLLIARVTGMILGYAVPDRYSDLRLVLAVFEKAHEKVSKSVNNYFGKPRFESDVSSKVVSVETFMQQLHAIVGNIGRGRR